ncbi:MAG: VCBS repeat-containing protein, partial [Planctomycetota bacterium]
MKQAKPVGVCAADFDGDGTDDLALSFLTPGGSIVWRGSSGGLEREGLPRAFGDYPLPPLALPRGTFGASGRAAQLALCSRSTRVLEIVSPFSTSALAPITLEHVPRAMASGIVQGHAWLAIACDEQRLEVLREGSAKPEPWSISGLYPRCALISEELSAVLVGFQDSESIEAYDAPGAAPIGKLELGGMPRDMAVIDIDGDGDLELVVAGGDHELWIFGLSKPGGARAWFEPGAPAIWQAGAIPLQLAVADFDADGKPDLAVLHHYDLSVHLLTKLSAAGPGKTSSLYAGQTPVGFAALEGDGDARMDVVVVNRDTQGLGILPGDGAGALVAGTSLTLGDFPNALAAISASQQKQAGLRLVALNSKSNDVSAVVLEAGKLRALPGVACGGEPRAPQIAELDGTAGLDVLLLGTGPGGAQLLWMRGDATGKLERPAVLELGG